MKKLLKWAAIAVVVVVVGLAGGFGWASSAAAGKLAQSYEAHSVDIPVPMPLSEAELAEIKGAGGEAEAGGEEGAPAAIDEQAIALERAIARGKHLVSSRYVCVECHGKDFGGGVMVEDPAMGSILGPNLTSGAGSRTKDYTIADWDRIVRHGIRADKRPALMPSEDFVNMSDRELSDIVAYIRSMPAVDKEVPQSSLGPVAKVLMATGKFPLSADMVHDHQGTHTAEAPASEVTPEFGKHVAQVCTGCHRADFSGGPIPVGPPSWPPSANLTSHKDGIAGWTFEQFADVMRTGKRADGTMVLEPMSLIPQYGAKMTDTEMKALWTYLQSLPPVPKNK